MLFVARSLAPSFLSFESPPTGHASRRFHPFDLHVHSCWALPELNLEAFLWIRILAFRMLPEGRVSLFVLLALIL
jgi:hypothetical protein